MGLTNKKKLEYYRKKETINNLIKKQAKKRGSILFGGRALNLQLNSSLRRPTEDFDIYSKTPKKSATRIERKLDKHIDADMFFIKPAMHPGTWKVMNRATNREVADYSKPPENVQTRQVNGLRVASLPFIKKQRQEILKDPESRFRHKKDKDAIQRINLQQSLKKKKRVIRMKPSIFNRVGMLR